MRGSSSAHPEGGTAKRVGRFSRKAPGAAPGLEAVIETYQRRVEERLEEGLRGIQQAAVSLMHEIASEVWRASPDGGDAQARILEQISRDQTVRSLIAHSDERFQALAVRTARLEDTLADLAGSTRALKEVLARGAQALADAAASPALRGVEEVREQLQEIQEHIARAFKHLADRDLALVESITSRVREHGELVARETARIAQAIEGYLQGGLELMTGLAGRTEEELSRAAARGDDVAALLQAIRQQVARLDEGIRSVEAGFQQAGQALAEEVQGRLDQVARRAEEGARAVGEGLEATARSLAEGLAAGNRELAERVEAATGGLREQVEEATRSLAERVEAATGALAGAVDEGIRAIGERSEAAVRSVGEALSAHESWVLKTLEAQAAGLDDRVRGIHERLQGIDEGLRAEVRALAGAAHQAARDSAAAAAREVAGGLDARMQALNQAFEARVMGLARLVRSDSERLRDALVQAVAARDEATARALEERLTHLSELLSTATEWTAQEVTRRVEEVTQGLLQGRFDEVVSVIDRNTVRLADTLESQLARVSQGVGQRAAEAAEAAVATHVGRTVERLEQAVGSVVGLRDDVARARDEHGAALLRIQRDSEAALVRIREETEAALARHVDERVAALARMIRSDNRVIAEHLQRAAEQEPAKQALRAVKELQAGLAAEIMERVDRRFAAMAEQLHRETQTLAASLARTTEALSERVDRAVAAIHEAGPGREIQAVMERMGDAMHALATLGRAGPVERIRLD